MYSPMKNGRWDQGHKERHRRELDIWLGIKEKMENLEEMPMIRLPTYAGRRELGIEFIALNILSIPK